MTRASERDLARELLLQLGVNTDLLRAGDPAILTARLLATPPEAWWAPSTPLERLAHACARVVLRLEREGVSRPRAASAVQRYVCNVVTFAGTPGTP